MAENEQLTMNLNIKTREYLKLIEETRDSIEILDQIKGGGLSAKKDDDGE